MQNEMTIEALLKKMEEESGGEPKPMKLFKRTTVISSSVDALEFLNGQG